MILTLFRDFLILCKMYFSSSGHKTCIEINAVGSPESVWFLCCAHSFLGQQSFAALQGPLASLFSVPKLFCPCLKLAMAQYLKRQVDISSREKVNLELLSFLKPWLEYYLCTLLCKATALECNFFEWNKFQLVLLNFEPPIKNTCWTDSKWKLGHQLTLKWTSLRQSIHTDTWKPNLT